MMQLRLYMQQNIGISSLTMKLGKHSYSYYHNCRILQPKNRLWAKICTALSCSFMFFFLSLCEFYLQCQLAFFEVCLSFLNFYHFIMSLLKWQWTSVLNQKKFSDFGAECKGQLLHKTSFYTNMHLTVLFKVLLYNLHLIFYKTFYLCIFQEWPQEGVVVFNKYATRYREGLDLVVKDINIHVDSGEKVSWIIALLAWGLHIQHVLYIYLKYFL